MILVEGPSQPAAAAQTSGESSTTSGGSSSGASGTAAASPPKPLATADLVSSSLQSALSNGVAISYSVSEQVAGHFEILLADKVAKELGIKGSPALELPAGSEPQIVLARSLLVTIKGGKSVVHVKLSKHTTERLRHRKRITLELRLIVHNAAVEDPESTTVISATTLGPPKPPKHTHHAH
jgi:hypothetical protein